MEKISEIEFRDDADLRQYLKNHPESIEKGMEILKTEFKAETIGRIDLLARDADKVATVIELKTKEEDSQLDQGLLYYDWVESNKYMLGEAYDIEPTEEARLILIAPSFSERLQKIARYVDINLQLLKYTAVEVKGERGVLTEEVEVTPVVKPEVEKKTIEDHIEYIKDPEVRDSAERFIEEVESWEDADVEAIKRDISMKVRGSVFVYLAPRRNYFWIYGHNEEGEWKKLAKVKSSEDLEEALSVTKEAYTRKGGEIS